jgi:hypothetical protein
MKFYNLTKLDVKVGDIVYNPAILSPKMITVCYKDHSVQTMMLGIYDFYDLFGVAPYEYIWTKTLMLALITNTVNRIIKL